MYHNYNRRSFVHRYNGYQTNYQGMNPQPYQQQMPYAPPIPYGYSGYPNQQGNYNLYPQQQPAYNNQYFQNPLQPEEANYYPQQGSYNEYQGMTNPYPKGSFMVKPPASGVGTIMNSFKSQDGSLDFNKMVNTAGQMMNAMNQVSSMVKGLGGMFKV
ncbi:YppG family protein [Bacillus sp. SG-1]|uniref:YppG family protein n=1 Tax=Bacillus sp. SG-1 TaxID=161544 RepID=UPI0003001B89|nr:YppG family protein [Bacillus sp. SG-1]